MQTITFTEQPLFTVKPKYLCKVEKVSFIGEIVSDAAQPDTPVIAANTSYTGPVTMRFSKAVDKVEFDAGYFDEIGSTRIRVYDKNGNLLHSELNSQIGVQHFSFDYNKDIGKVKIIAIGDEPAGFSVDSVKFTVQPPQVNASGNDDIDGILWGYKWDHKALTYSFPGSANEYTTNGYQQVAGFQAMTAGQKTALTKIIGNYADVCGLSFTKTNKANADIRFAQATSIDYSDGTGAHTPGNGTAEGNPPDPSFAVVGQGDCWFNVGNYSPTPALGTYTYSAGLMHELGHSVGLKHGHVTQTGHGHLFPKLPADHDSYEYSIMTYHQYVGDVTPGDNAPDHPTSLMQDDIAALQYIYGADYHTRHGNTTYTWDSHTGEMSINGQRQGTHVHNKVLLTIWDGGGHDTYDFSNYNSKVKVNLNPGAWTKLKSSQFADLGDGHMARGNIANALLYEGNTKSLIEDAKGGDGNDKIVGNKIANKLYGGKGADDLRGGKGKDLLDGGRGGDELNGGDGKDKYDFKDGPGHGVDTITKFEANEFIRLDDAHFAGIDGNASGVLRSKYFVQSSSAQDGNDHIVYWKNQGKVYYDPDGKGGADQILFAKLDNKPHLDHGDFLVI